MHLNHYIPIIIEFNIKSKDLSSMYNEDYFYFNE